MSNALILQFRGCSLLKMQLAHLATFQILTIFRILYPELPFGSTPVARPSVMRDTLCEVITDHHFHWLNFTDAHIPLGGTIRSIQWVSDWVGFNGTSTQFRSLAPSLSRKADAESPTVKESRRYINIANAIALLPRRLSVQLWRSTVAINVNIGQNNVVMTSTSVQKIQ